MNFIKKILIYIILFFLLIILFNFGFHVYRDWSLKNEVNSYDNYYKKLGKECLAKNSGRSCCMSSVRSMERGEYKLAPKSGCQEGYRVEMLKCIDSFKWCQPRSE